MARQRFTTPAGILTFPCFIDEPDTSYTDETNENDLGDFKARIRLDPNDAEVAEFLAFLQSAYDTNLEEHKVKLGKAKLKQKDEGKPWMSEQDEDGNDTGMILVRTKLTRRVTKRDGSFFEQSPKVFDAEGKPLSESPRVGPGTKAKIGGEIHGWYNGGLGVGITLWCQAVQVIEFVEKFHASNKGAEDYGFAVQKFDDEKGHDF